HNLPVHAEAALKGLRVNPRLLNGVRFLRCAETLERRDLLVRCRRDGGDARPYRLAFHDYRARTALTQAASESRSTTIKIIAKDVQQRRGRIDVHLHRLAIDLQVHYAHRFFSLLNERGLKPATTSCDNGVANLVVAGFSPRSIHWPASVEQFQYLNS